MVPLSLDVGRRLVAECYRRFDTIYYPAEITME